MRVLVRVRAFAGYFVVLALLAAASALVVTAAPRVAQRLSDEGLRRQIGTMPAAARDVTYRLPGQFNRVGQVDAAALQRRLDDGYARMPAGMRAVVTQRWYSGETDHIRTDGPDLHKPGPPLDLILRAAGGAEDAVTMTAGHWPRATGEIALAATVADQLGLRVGSRLTTGSEVPLRLTVAGLFTARDPADGRWDPIPPTLTLTPPSGLQNPDPYTAVALTTEAMLTRLPVIAGEPVSYLWRYRVDPSRLTTDRAADVLAGMRRLDRTRDRGAQLSQGLEQPLLDFQAARDAARGVLFVVLSAVLATLAGLVVLTARLLARRREREVALLRARGASLPAVASRGAAESLLVVAPAVVAGWLAGGPFTWAVPAAVVLIAAAFPVAVLASRGGRHRLIVEAAVVVLAVAGAYLLRQRGLPAAGTIDPLLVCVPVLLSAAVALLILRGYPWLLRAAGPPVARARGAVAFLGVALARRATTGALVVVVIAVAGAAFCAAAATGIRDGRDRAARLAVPGDLVLTGDRFADDTAGALAALPGVRTVSPLVAHATETLSGAAEPAYVLIVDGPSLTAGLDGSALVSPDVAGDLKASRGTVNVDNRLLSFRAGSVASSFPLIPPGTRRFVVLPAAAVTEKLTPTGFVLTGTPDPGAVERAGIAGRTRYFTTGLVVNKPPDVTPVVTTHAAVRAALDDGGANGLLSFGFAAGVLGGLLLALAAVAAAVLADAPGRARIQARLRTMGLSRRQRNRIVLIELAPAVGLAVLAGAAVGVLLPVIVGPALRLSAFTGGVAVGLGADPRLAGGVVVFGLLALALALAVEAMAARRLDRVAGWRED